jgi:NAD(P)-dependent dehydrogenase (short-subunit alcohol dehydrogenase family)
MTSRVWFVTGASSGFGRVLTEAVLARGERVAATARTTSTLDDLAARYDEGQLLRVPLDVTDAGQVRSAVDAAVGWGGRIDVLVNNAGHGAVGALEELSEETVRGVLEVNLFGVIAVTRAVLPHMRAVRSGHIVQLSSVGGVVANPGHAIYGTSKFALEGLSEALAGEVGALGIRVTLVEPGPFRTDFAGRSMSFAEPIEDYRDTPAGQLRARFSDQDGAQPNDPRKAVEAIIRVVDDPSAPLRLPLGPEAVRRIREKLTRQLADLDAWEAVSLDTRFDRPDA